VDLDWTMRGAHVTLFMPPYRPEEDDSRKVPTSRIYYV